MRAGVVILAMSMLSGAADPPARTMTTLFRFHAISSPLPEYPKSAFAAQRTGRVVVDVIAERDGSVRSVEILEAPAPEMASSVQSAVRQWRFQPFVSKTLGTRVTGGRLIFYFTILQGTPHVIDAVAARLAIEKRQYESRIDAEKRNHGGAARPMRISTK